MNLRDEVKGDVITSTLAAIRNMWTDQTVTAINNFMKKTLITLIASLAIPIAVHSQILSTKKDDFSGEKTKSAIVFLQGGTSLISIPGFMVTLNFTERGPEKQISLIHMTSAYNETWKVEDLSLLLKLGDGTILRYTPNNESAYTKQDQGQSVTAVLSLLSNITNNDLDKIADHSVQKIRLGFKNGEGLDFEIKPKQIKEITKAVNYIRP